jgi:hypothetical protein
MLVGNSLSSVPVLTPQKCSSSAALATPIDTFKDAFQQCLEDHHRQPEGPSMFVYGMSQILGRTLTRRLSNLVSCFGLGHFFVAQRDYPILQPHDELALKFQPRLLTINEKQMGDSSLKPNQLRYEILPAAQDKDTYSIIYYVGLPSEELPIPILGKLYNLIRPVLYGSKQDWEAIQVDIDKNTGEPVGLSYETSNYSNTPMSYNLTNSVDLHLLTKVSKMPDGSWRHTVKQKNGSIQSTQVDNPFKDTTHAALCLVAWNGSLDITERVAQNSHLKQYPLDDSKLQFLDIDTYQNEGFDLRATWVEKQLSLVLPRRQHLVSQT